MENSGFENDINSYQNNGDPRQRNAPHMTSSALQAQQQRLPMPVNRSSSLTFDPKALIIDSNDNVQKKVDSDDEEGEDLPLIKQNFLTKSIVKARSSISQLGTKHSKILKSLLLITIFGLYNAYLIICVAYNRRHDIAIEWCDGLGLLIILTAFLYWGLFYYHVLKKYFGKYFRNTNMPTFFSKWYFQYGLTALVLGGILTFLIIDSADDRKRLNSVGGIFAIILLGFLLSAKPGHIKWRQVLVGLLIQFSFGLIILRWPTGREIFDCASSKVKIFLDYSDEGSVFIYNYLSSGLELTIANKTDTTDEVKLSLPSTFAFKTMPVIFFFSFFISLLYHFGAMQFICSKLGWFLQVTIGTTAGESMNAAANIFVGQTEAPILIKPFLGKMTHSELHAVMTGGFATIAGGVMAAYIGFGIEAAYLLSASFMAAPAALALSKLMYPESKVSRTTSADIEKISTKVEGNALDAAAKGASEAIMLIANIIANLIAFIAFVAFLNAVIGWFGSLCGVDELSFEWILSKLFIPLAYIVGVDAEETEDVALLLGLKTTVNEFIAYERMKNLMCLSPRSEAIATYALCSFANVSSIGIQLGGLGSMAPERRPELAKLIGRALLTGTLCGLLNGCIAGALLQVDGYPARPDIPRCNTGRNAMF